jgi:hypothetical protein
LDPYINSYLLALGLGLLIFALFYGAEGITFNGYPEILFDDYEYKLYPYLPCVFRS